MPGHQQPTVIELDIKPKIATIKIIATFWEKKDEGYDSERSEE